MTDYVTLMEASWPPAERLPLGPFVLRRGAGGGQRVSAASAIGDWNAQDLDRAEAAMRAHLNTVHRLILNRLTAANAA